MRKRKESGKNGRTCKRIGLVAIICLGIPTLIYGIAMKGRSHPVPLFQVCWEDTPNSDRYYAVNIEDQLYDIKKAVVTAPKDTEGRAVFYDSEGESIKEYSIVSGENTLELTPDTEIAVIEAGSSDTLKLEGELSEKGQKEMENAHPDNPLYAKSLSVLGDSLSAYTEYIPDGYLTFYPSEDVQRVSDMWWYRLAKSMGMYLCKINASAGSGVTGLEISESGDAGERGKELHLPGYTPDVIFVWLGGNDALAGVSMEKIMEEYHNIVQDILLAYSDSDIYLCTYIDLSPELTQLNNGIRETADEYGVQLMDVADCGITAENYRDYIPDGAHPNKRGFRLIAAWMESKLK